MLRAYRWLDGHTQEYNCYVAKVDEQMENKTRGMEQLRKEGKPLYWYRLWFPAVSCN